MEEGFGPVGRREVECSDAGCWQMITVEVTGHDNPCVKVESNCSHLGDEVLERLWSRGDVRAVQLPGGVTEFYRWTGE